MDASKHKDYMYLCYHSTLTNLRSPYTLCRTFNTLCVFIKVFQRKCLMTHLLHSHSTRSSAQMYTFSLGLCCCKQVVHKIVVHFIHLYCFVEYTFHHRLEYPSKLPGIHRGNECPFQMPLLWWLCGEMFLNCSITEAIIDWCVQWDNDHLKSY